MKAIQIATAMLLAIVANTGFFSPAFAGKFVRVSPDLQIHYEEAGAGAPIVFIPGWSSSTEYYARQLDHFSKSHRAIAYDPRSQGLSDKTAENNHYLQHGADLKAFLDALELKDAVLVAHSNGCYDVYAYVRQYGLDNIKAMVAIDCSPPKQISTEGSDTWVRFKEGKEMVGAYRAITYKRADVVPAVFQKMVTRQLTPEESTFFAGMVARTPNHVSTLLLLDGNFSDYIAEARLIGSERPVFYFLGEDGFFGKPPEVAKAWLSENMPRAETAVFGKHLLHWEFPERFNATLDGFLAKIEK